MEIQSEKYLAEGRKTVIRFLAGTVIIPVATKLRMALISNFRRVLYVVCFLLGNSPASEFYMPTFRNTLSVPSS